MQVKTLTQAVKDNGIKILVHALAGAGKTVLCATTGVKTLMISAEGGLLSIVGAVDTGLLPESVLEDMEVLEINNITDLDEAYNYAVRNNHSWVAIDSISEIADVLLSNELDKSPDPRQAYGALINEMGKILRKFRDIPGKNVIMTCKQQRQKDDDTGLTMYLPSMPGAKLHQSIPYLFDEVFTIRMVKDEETKADYRMLQTSRDRNYEAKDRSGKLEMFEEPNIFNIMKKIKGRIVETVEPTAPDGETWAECDMFWLAVDSGGLATTKKDEDIQELLDATDVKQITESEYNEFLALKTKSEEKVTEPDSKTVADIEESDKPDNVIGTVGELAQEMEDALNSDDGKQIVLEIIQEAEPPIKSAEELIEHEKGSLARGAETAEKESESEGEAGEEVKVVISEKEMYWLDVDESTVFKTDAGIDIGPLIASGEEYYESITKLKFAKLFAQQD